jgi:hypothetical protein
MVDGFTNGEGIPISVKPISEEEPELEPEHEPEIHNTQSSLSPNFWDQDFLDRLQHPQSQPPTNQTTTTATQNIHGSIMYEFLDTPQQNIIQPPPYTTPRNAYMPHYQSTCQENSMLNFGYNDPNQAGPSNTNYSSFHDPNQAGPSNTNYPTNNNPQYDNPMYNNPNYNRPPTPTNLLSHFSPGIDFNFDNPGNQTDYGNLSLGRLSMNSNEQFLDLGWPTREHDVSLTLGHSTQIQPTTDNDDEDQHDPQEIHRERNRRRVTRRRCGTGHFL